MKIAGSTCLVTGANRGLGKAFAQSLLHHGAAKVYAGARHPETVDSPDLVPVALDITSQADVARAAEDCRDVTVLVNNAGIMRGAQPLAEEAMEASRAEMETNYFGTMAMCRAFAPVLGVNGGGALVNMLSVVSWVASPLTGTYCFSKAAAWLLTNGVRQQLREQGTLVVGVHASLIDTDMASGLTGYDKIGPDDVAEQMVTAVETDREEVLADPRTREVKASLPDDLALLYPH